MTTKMYVKLNGSTNERLTYPCFGLLEFMEGNHIAVFRVDQNGRLSVPVEANSPEFERSRAIDTAGADAVADLEQRQRAGQEYKSHPHTVLVEGGRGVIAMLPNENAVAMFVQRNCLRIEKNVIHTGPDGIKGNVQVYVYPTIGTKALAAICSILSNDEASNDEELKAQFVTEFGLSEMQAREHLELRSHYLRGLHVQRRDARLCREELSAGPSD